MQITLRVDPDTVFDGMPGIDRDARQSAENLVGVIGRHLVEWYAAELDLGVLTAIERRIVTPAANGLYIELAATPAERVLHEMSEARLDDELGELLTVLKQQPERWVWPAIEARDSSATDRTDQSATDAGDDDQLPANRQDAPGNTMVAITGPFADLTSDFVQQKAREILPHLPRYLQLLAIKNGHRYRVGGPPDLTDFMRPDHEPED